MRTRAAADAPRSMVPSKLLRSESHSGVAARRVRIAHEVAFLANELQHVVHIHAAKRLDGVVLVWAHRPFGVEEAHARIMAAQAHTG